MLTTLWAWRFILFSTYFIVHLFKSKSHQFEYKDIMGGCVKNISVLKVNNSCYSHPQRRVYNLLKNGHFMTNYRQQSLGRGSAEHVPTVPWLLLSFPEVFHVWDRFQHITAFFQAPKLCASFPCRAQLLHAFLLMSIRKDAKYLRKCVPNHSHT